MAQQPDGVVPFYPYQRAFFEDPARICIALWCRQAGKDFATAAKRINRCLKRPGRRAYIVSTTQRQADETFAKCIHFAEALKAYWKIAGRLITKDGEPYDDYDKEIDHHFSHTARRLHLPGGGMVISLPGRNPDNLAGFSGDVTFTEFGLFPGGGYEHWRVVAPIATRDYELDVIATPRGKNTKLFDLWSSPDRYSVHTVDINRAVAEGMPLGDSNGRPCSIEEYRELYGDEAGWQREYLLKFSGDLEALVTWAMLVEAGERGRDVPFDLLRCEGDQQIGLGFLDAIDREARLEVGWDVARTGNLSAIAINRVGPGAVRQLAGTVLMKNCTFAAQREQLVAIMSGWPKAVGCGDATGLGMDSNETLHARFGSRWQPVTFTSATKREIGSLLATCFADAGQTLPPTDGEHKCLATDIYAVQAERGGANLVLVEGQNPLLPDSHCDFAYALGLARMAASIKTASPYVSVI